MLRKLFAVALVSLGLVACDSVQLGEKLTLANQSITSTTRVAIQAYQNGHIDRKGLCVVEQYGRLAGAAIDAGFDSYVRGLATLKPADREAMNETASFHLGAAMSIIQRTSAEAANQVRVACAGVVN